MHIQQARADQESDPRPDPRLQVFPRCPPHSMTTAELMEILQRFKHPRLNSIGIISNRWGDRIRREVGLVGRYGSVYVATCTDRELPYLIPLDSIPYMTRREAFWDEKQNRFRQDFGRVTVRGWRNLLANLVKDRSLRPDDELSYLIGEDTFKLAPDGVWS